MHPIRISPTEILQCGSPSFVRVFVLGKTKQTRLFLSNIIKHWCCKLLPLFSSSAVRERMTYKMCITIARRNNGWSYGRRHAIVICCRRLVARMFQELKIITTRRYICDKRKTLFAWSVYLYNITQQTLEERGFDNLNSTTGMCRVTE